MRVVRVEGGAVVGRPFPKPDRFGNTTLGRSPASLNSVGLYPVVVENPKPPSDLQERVGADLTINNERGIVTETVVYGDKPLDDMKAVVREKVLTEYERQLAEGFTDANGITWAGTQDARDKMLELASGLGVSDRLPKGQSTISLKDRSGTPRDLTKSEIKTLANNALDFKYDADERRDTLLGQIETATSKNDLPSDSDIQSGWP